MQTPKGDLSSNQGSLIEDGYGFLYLNEYQLITKGCYDLSLKLSSLVDPAPKPAP